MHLKAIWVLLLDLYYYYPWKKRTPWQVVFSTSHYGEEGVVVVVHFAIFFDHFTYKSNQTQTKEIPPLLTSLSTTKSKNALSGDQNELAGKNKWS